MIHRLYLNKAVLRREREGGFSPELALTGELANLC